MIQVEVTERLSAVSDIVISGHAMYDVHGQDIVCAAVSLCCIGALNALDMMCENEFDLKMESNQIHIHVKKNNDKVQTLLQFLLIQLQCVFEQYPENIKITRKEV